jgi:hypothetical protein
MTTHYHLLVRTPSPDLARGMQYLNACYAQGFNRRHGEIGHRLERRYRSTLIDSDAHALESLRYLALNPVRAGACRAPEQWKWSSYAAVTGRAPAPQFLAVDVVLGYFGSNRTKARRRFEAFVRDTADLAAVVKGSDPGHDGRVKGGYSGPERRSGKDRRTGGERRKKRGDKDDRDRRSGKDRRSGDERREKDS